MGGLGLQMLEGSEEAYLHRVFFFFFFGMSYVLVPKVRFLSDWGSPRGGEAVCGS